MQQHARVHRLTGRAPQGDECNLVGYDPAMRDVYRLADFGDSLADEANVRLGVLGDPVAHSRSPQMMNAALRACKIPLQYARFQIAPDELEAALRTMAKRNFIGVNLTIPHKRAALSLMDELDEFARAAGAVNCVRFVGNRLVGFNTDGPGFARAILEDFAVELSYLRVLLLGAGGGAGRAIAQQCAGCRRLIIANRTFEKAEQLARRLGVEAIEWSDEDFAAATTDVDLVVNATPIGMKQDDPPILAPELLSSRLLVYDIVYEPRETRLLQAASLAGARSANGLSMLLHQAALAFEIWFDRPAPIEAMRQALAD